MNDPVAIRILLADDHILFRRGLARVLAAEPGFMVVGEAGDGAEAVAQALVLRPDVVLMDVRMPGLGGLEATRQLVERLPGVKIVMLTVTDDEDTLFEAIKCGARGLLSKTIEPSALFKALRGIVQGEAALSTGLTAKLLLEFSRQAARPRTPVGPDTALSPREQEVLTQLAAGRSNKEIAAALGIVEDTVKNHVKHILEKLHLENRVQAAVYAFREGKTPPPRGTNPQGGPRRPPLPGVRDI
jgi:DNA-binding NarL/FixJ family response regulator